MTEEKRFSSDLGPLHMSPITGFTGSVTGLTGTNFQRPHDKDEIQETKPRLKMVEQYIIITSLSAVVALWALVPLLIKLIRALLKWKYIQDKNYAISTAMLRKRSSRV